MVWFLFLNKMVPKLTYTRVTHDIFLQSTRVQTACPFLA